MTAIFKHELRNYFHTITAYVFGAFLLMVVGIGSMLYNIQASVSNFEYVLGFSSMIFIIIVPILTMRVIAEERKQRTDQLLYSLPLTTTQVVLGKYLALLTVFALPLCVIAIYPLIFAKFGDVHLMVSYSSLAAFFMTGAALTAMGVFISSLTENQGFAAGIGIAVILLNYFSVSLAEHVSATASGSLIVLCLIFVLCGIIVKHLTRNKNAGYIVSGVLIAATLVFYLVDTERFEGLLPRIMHQLSLFERLNMFINGVFDMTAIVYFLTFIVFFLFLSVQSLEKRRYN